MSDPPPPPPPPPSSSPFPFPFPFALCHEDLLHNILCRLPARSFAYASCVCKSWHRVSAQIFSRPIFASAISLNPSADHALLETLDEVLSAPVRPHFAIVNVTATDCDLQALLKLATDHLGIHTPIVVSSAFGVFGRHASTDEVIEVQMGCDDSNGHAIALTIGFLPGLKVDVIPLLQPRQGSALVNEFVMDIRNFASPQVPAAIMMFGDGGCDLQYAVEMLVYAMPVETAIAGDERCRFVYQAGDNAGRLNSAVGLHYREIAVALTFMRASNKIPGIGEIEFHVALSEGVSALGPIYRAVSVRTSDRATWLTARRDGSPEILDGQRMLMDIDGELDNRINSHDLYVGVIKRRKYAIRSLKVGLMTSLSYHSIFREDEENVYVEGAGIKTADRFQFYAPDSALALSTCEKAGESLKRLNQGAPASNCNRTVAVSSKEVFGGFIFSCCGRGKCFFECANVDSSPFTKNFPGVPFTGTFCGGEIGRWSGCLMDLSPGDSTHIPPCSHVYSSVYLVMSYTSPQ